MLSFARWLLEELPNPVKFIITTILKSALAAMLFTLVAEYATAWFAMKYGVRVPLEGVPYLSLTIGIISFFIFAASTPLFVLFMSWFVGIRTQLIGAGLNKQMRLFFSKVVLALAIIFLVTGVAALFNSSFASLLWPLVGKGVAPIEVSSIVFLKMLFVFIVFLAVSFAAMDFNWFGAQTIAFIVVGVTAALLLFVHDVYGSMLRIIRYGGGIEVTVVTTHEEKHDTMRMKANLIWITQSCVTLYRPALGDIVEIPRSNIISVLHEPIPDWKLPPRNPGSQASYAVIELPW